MPMYSFVCDCGEEKTVLFKSINSEQDVVCDECGSEMKRAMYNENTNFDLKGGGWYADGYQKGRS